MNKSDEKKKPLIISAVNMKGGTGKTSLIFNLSALLSEDSTVLLLDLDAQSNLSTNFGLRAIDVKGKKTSVDLMESSTPASQLILPTEFSNLSIIPSRITLSATEINLTARTGREYILRSWIDDNIDVLSSYDYLIIDTNPSFNLLNQNALVVSDSVILVGNADINAIDGALQLISLWGRVSKLLNVPRDNIKALVLNAIDKRLRISSDIVRYVENHKDLKEILMPTTIPVNVKLNEAASAFRPISFYDQNSSGFRAYKQLLSDLKERGVV